MSQCDNQKNFLLEFVDTKDTPDDEYSIVFEHVINDLYTDGTKYYEITESSVYMVAAKGKAKRKKKVNVYTYARIGC